ncbi:MAG: GNAT family N-acetyltransferase [Planctomycetota bacterium]
MVNATLLDGLRPSDLDLIERGWSPYRLRTLERLLRSGAPREDWPESLHWDWSKKRADLRLLEASGFGIVCNEDWQGVLMTKTASHAARLPDDTGKPIVYVDYVEVAPWNWRIESLGQKSRFMAVGAVLMRTAIRQSLEEGFRARVGLHSLPQAEVFYRNTCGMTPLGRDDEKQNLLYFEFSSEQAKSFLDQGGAS